MPNLDSTAVAHIDSNEVTKPIFLLFFDVDGDPIYATTTSYPVTMPSHADPDISLKTFLPTNGVMSVSDISQRADGSDTVRVSLSGLLLPDADLLAALADRANWQGRVARIWVIVRDQANVQKGAIGDYYTGYMNSTGIDPSPTSQTIEMEIEGYLALITRASNRTYLDQAEFDPGDESAKATIGAANGAKAGPSAGLGYSSGGTPNTAGGDRQYVHLQ